MTIGPSSIITKSVSISTIRMTRRILCLRLMTVPMDRHFTISATNNDRDHHDPYQGYRLDGSVHAVRIQDLEFGIGVWECRGRQQFLACFGLAAGRY